MLEQLDHNEKDILYNSSDSDEEDLIVSKLIQELSVRYDVNTIGGGDFEVRF